MQSYIYFTFYLGLFNSFIRITDGACTLPSYMTGTWYDSRYKNVTFTGGTTMFFHNYPISRSGSTSNLTCEISSGNIYVFRTIDSARLTISSQEDDYYYYLCMEVTQVTSRSFYYYPQAVKATNGERVTEKKTSETVTSTSEVCSATPIGKELFHTMVHTDYVSSALTQCPDPFLGDFAFTLSDTLNTASSGNITGCNTLKTANVTYSTSQSIKVAFSATKYYGCVASFVSGSTYYAAWYNFDPNPDTSFNTRFGCVVATYDGTNVTASQRSRLCSSGQTSTAMPSNIPEWDDSSSVGGLLYLVPYRTCVPTDPESSSSSSSSAGVIAAAVIIILLLIAAAVGGYLFYRFYYLPKQEEKRKRLEEQKKPKSHIGMMKKAVDAGFGGNIHKEKAKPDIIDMVEIDDDDGVEGSVTGMHPNAFKEHNNNMKLNAKFIGTTTPLTPSGIETDFDDPNAVPESSLTRQKTKLTSGFSANTQGTTSNDTPTSTAEQNGHTPRSSAVQNGKNISKSMAEQNGNLLRSSAELNSGLPSSGVAKPVNDVQPSVMTSASVHNDITRIQREKSIVPNSDSKPGDTGRSGDGKSADQKATVATVSPFVEEKPKILQDNTKQEDSKREEKLRKSVSFAGDKPKANAVTNSDTSSNEAKPKEANLPGTVPELPDPEITLPREPSNLMGPRDTTLPEIDLKKF